LRQDILNLVENSERGFSSFLKKKLTITMLLGMSGFSFLKKRIIKNHYW